MRCTTTVTRTAVTVLAGILLATTPGEAKTVLVGGVTSILCTLHCADTFLVTCSNSNTHRIQAGVEVSGKADVILMGYSPTSVLGQIDAWSLDSDNTILSVDRPGTTHGTMKALMALVNLGDFPSVISYEVYVSCLDIHVVEVGNPTVVRKQDN